MAIEIVVPAMGESVVEATVSRWLKKEGDHVAVGEAVVELETEKVNLEVGAEQAGTLVSIKRQEGEDVEIGDVLALLEAESGNGRQGDGRQGDGRQGDGRQGDGRQSDGRQGDGRQSDEETAGEPEKIKEQAEAEPVKEEAPAQEQADASPETAGKKVTPMAKRLAQEYDVDLEQVSGSGQRISKEDVTQYLEQAESKAGKPQPAAKPEEEKPALQAETKPTASAESTAPAEPIAPAKPIAPAERVEREERNRMSRRRQTIARRLVEAQQTAAMLTTFNEVDMSAVVALRRRRQDSFRERQGVKLGFMSFFVKAAVGALKQFPRLNAEIDGNEVVLKHYYDIGMAIGAEEGLVVPVLRHADRLSFAEIEQAIEAYVEKVKNSSLLLEDLQGGTFTITNGGVFGSLLSTPILNPPQVGILGLHKIEKRPIVIDDEIVIRPMMYVALSYDHRLVDGQEAVQFLVKLKELVEDPETLLLEG